MECMPMKHKQKTVWVVVADEAIARIVAWPERGDELVPVEELTDPDAHASGSELRRDAVGRRAAGAGRSHATASAGADEHRIEAETFARRVAQRLAEALQQRRFDVLHVVAAPRFLGLLRKAFNPQVAAVIGHELNKDLVHQGNEHITAVMLPLMFPGRAAA